MRTITARRWPLSVAFCAFVVLSGCRVTGPGRPEERPPAVRGERTVPLDVVTGPEGGVLALVPVSVRGQGPYRFALDTGATRSLLDQETAQQLGLPVVGRTRAVAGVVAAAEADQIRVEQWSIGDVSLPQATILSLPLPRGEDGDPLIRGLLGSDVLSQFGAIVIDYERQELVLRPRR